MCSNYWLIGTSSMCATEYMYTHTPGGAMRETLFISFFVPFSRVGRENDRTDWDGCLTDDGRCCISALCQLLTVHTTNLRNMKWFSLSLFRTNTHCRLLSPSLPRAPFCQHTRRSKKKMMIFTVTQVCGNITAQRREREREFWRPLYAQRPSVFERERLSSSS